MRAKSLNENIDNILKGKSHDDIIKEKLKLIDNIQKQFINSMKIIRMVVTDYQLQKNHDDYKGYLTIGIDIISEEYKEALLDFVAFYNRGNMHRNVIDNLLVQIGLGLLRNYPYLQPEEIVFYEKDIFINEG